MVGDIPVLAQRVLPVWRAGQTVWVMFCAGSHVDQAHDSTLPFTPFCVLPDFVLSLTSMCSLDPMLAPGAPASAVLGGAAAAGQMGGRQRPRAHTGAHLLHQCGCGS